MTEDSSLLAEFEQDAGSPLYYYGYCALYKRLFPDFSPEYPAWSERHVGHVYPFLTGAALMEGESLMRVKFHVRDFLGKFTDGSVAVKMLGVIGEA